MISNGVHKPKKLVLGFAPKKSEMLAVAVVYPPEEATRESEAFPCPLPEGRSVIDAPSCAVEPFKNHWMSGAPPVVGTENGAA